MLEATSPASNADREIDLAGLRLPFSRPLAAPVLLLGCLRSLAWTGDSAPWQCMLPGCEEQALDTLCGDATWAKPFGSAASPSNACRQMAGVLRYMWTRCCKLQGPQFCAPCGIEQRHRGFFTAEYSRQAGV